MTVIIEVRQQDKESSWLALDLYDEVGVETMVVIPLFGPDHNAGMDCWCQPQVDGGVIVHNTCH